MDNEVLHVGNCIDPQVSVKLRAANEDEVDGSMRQANKLSAR